MSTRSYIGVIRPSGIISAVYCHWDGYPSHNGLLLYRHYNDYSKACTLIEHGSISVLREHIGEKHDMNDHSPDRPGEKFGWCDFFSRDSGDVEGECRVQDFKTKKGLIKAGKESWAEYIYLFDEKHKKEWIFCEVTDGRNSFSSLQQYLEQMELIDPVESLLNKAKEVRR